MDFQPDLQKASTFIKNRKPPLGSGVAILICARVVPMDYWPVGDLRRLCNRLRG